MKATDPLRAFLRNVLGFEITRTQTLRENVFFRRKKRFLFEADPFFSDAYHEGLNASHTPDGDPNRRERFYNLAQLLGQTRGVEGRVVECGCWRGLSSFVLCRYLRAERPAFLGEDYFVVDSFQGLSQPGADDLIADPEVSGGSPRPGQLPGAYASRPEELRGALSDFPKIEIVEGWIPEALARLPEARYRFAHVDLDFYAPTLGALRYFYPRLAAGGILVCDDYGSLSWPGAKKAVEEYCAGERAPFLALSTGQAVLWKK